jgi:hypothetical protein
MRPSPVALLAAAAIAAVGCITAALADQGMKISGPHVHENIAVYFAHGPSAPGPVPLTLQEALVKGTVKIVETGEVNELKIENTGAEEVFIQAGDIVKGGRQDRVLTVSFLLSAKSGLIPIAAFCVEQGRWSARGGENLAAFSRADEAMPSRAALLAMTAPPGEGRVQAGQPPPRASSEVARRQQEVWDSVAKTQRDLSSGLNAPVASPQSATSLQLALENEKLKQARADFLKALEKQGFGDPDVIGYVVAINGKLVSANVYPSNALFKKLWSKQLAASVTEAISEKVKADAAAPPPTAAAAMDFLADAQRGQPQERSSAAGARLETRDSAHALYNEARSADGRWVHRSYLAK